MGTLSNIAIWVAANIPVVAKVVKKAAEVVHKAASVVEALFEGREVFDEEDKQQPTLSKKKKTDERPDVMGESNSQSRESEIAELHQSIDESKKKLSTIQEANELEHLRIQLQIDVMELIVSSSTFERFTNNINLHVANLQIHLQTIQNTAGLLDSVNRQRVAIKALMGTVNHLINVLDVGKQVNKIDGLDIDIRSGSVSIYKAYEAFTSTRKLLLAEIDSFSDAIQDQLGRVENVRKSARNIPSVSKKVSSWLSDSVEPKLLDAKKFADELKGELLVIPGHEANLRRELSDIKQEGL